MARMRSLLAAVAIATAGTALLAGCGSSASYSGPNLAKGLSAQQLQAQSLAQTLKLTSFVLGVNGTAAIAAQPNAIGTSGLAPLFTGTPVPIVGSGPVVPPDQFSLALNIDIAGTKTPVTLVQTGGHLYAIALGKTILLPVAHATANLRAVIAGLIRTMRAPSLGSTKTIAGIPAQELSGQLDGAAASQLVAPVLGLVPGASGAGSTRAQQLARQQALAAALGQGTLTEWVRVSDLRPAELEVVASIANGAAVSPALEHASFDVTLELSDYNVPETIAIPAGAQPMSAAQLQQLIGAG